MKLNTNYMSNGISSRRSEIFIFILVLMPFFGFTQFSHRIELIAEKTFSAQFDKKNTSKGYINYFENSTRNGSGTMISIKYNLVEIPVSLSLGIENTTLSDYAVKSNIEISDNSQELKLSSINFKIQYQIINKASFVPYLYLGMNLNIFHYQCTDLTYHYHGENNSEYIQIDDVNWSYKSIQTDFKVPGICGGAGIKLRLSDKIGINGSFNFSYIPQNKTDWLGHTIIIQTYNIGLYYRFFKRRNNIS